MKSCIEKFLTESCSEDQTPKEWLTEFGDWFVEQRRQGRLRPPAGPVVDARQLDMFGEPSEHSNADD